MMATSYKDNFTKQTSLTTFSFNHVIQRSFVSLFSRNPIAMPIYGQFSNSNMAASARRQLGYKESAFSTILLHTEC
jgi:hypothetical protein